MPKRYLIGFLMAAVFTFTLGWMGCSENESSIISSANDPVVNNTVNYFPLSEGHKIIYEVTYSNGTIEEVTFTVGAEVPFGVTTATQWFIESNDGSKDTNFIVTSDSSVYLYTDPQAIPEKLLSYPLLPGATWNRYVTNEEVLDDVLDDNDNPEVDEDDNGTENGILLPAYPTTGSGDMVVENAETIALSSGGAYSGSVRIRNNSSTEVKNYYWYTPGIGLTKYIIGTTDQTYPNGQIVGEMVYYF